MTDATITREGRRAVSREARPGDPPQLERDLERQAVRPRDPPERDRDPSARPNPTTVESSSRPTREVVHRALDESRPNPLEERAPSAIAAIT